jgi:predicted nuclease of restriction endonuclease-like (RecB) superfamily
MADEINFPTEYANFFISLKERVRAAQVKAALSVNRELVLLYWQIGKAIIDSQEAFSWGDKMLERLASDLRQEFPDMKGFSPRNLKYMRYFARTYPGFSIGQQPVAQLPWSHNIILMTKIKDADLRDWYAHSCIQFGWSRTILEMQIESQLHQRQGKAITNFSQTLPQPQSELVQQILKDPYNFDFLGIGKDALERELERGLLAHLKDFMLELGVGFALLGSQYHLEVGNEDFYIDLLFYHVRLHCYVVVELKARAFQPSDVGQINFYMAAVDSSLCQPEDNPTIRLLLCKTKNSLIVEYALKNTQAPLGVSEYQLTAALPDNLKTQFPSIEQLEDELLKLDAETPS